MILVKNVDAEESCHNCRFTSGVNCVITQKPRECEYDRSPCCQIVTENELIAAVTALLRQYFDVGDCYTYELTRDKKGFAVGTVDLDDFEEWDEENIEDLAQYIVSKLPEVLDAKEDR